MHRITTSPRFTKLVLLCLLCFDSVYLATIETVQRIEDEEEDIHVEDEVFYGKYEEILGNDFFRFTTRKRYIWEDYTVPTRDYSYNGSSGSSDFVLYIFIPIFVAVLIVGLIYACIKSSQSDNCCSFESDSDSADLFTTVHRPPERRRDVTAQVHRPPSTGNPYSDRSNGTPRVNISFVNTSARQSRTEPDYTVGEKPPDYATVTLNDLVNPNQPSFPVIRNDHETPPPEYGKENPLFR